MTRLRPAPEILLRYGPHAVTLRSSLRVAVALDALPGGLVALFDQIARRNITAMRAVIRAAAADRHEAERLLAQAATQPLAPFAHDAQAACLALLVSVLAPEGEAPTTPSADAIPLAEFFGNLFTFATTWLRWSPSETWNASLVEIIAALVALSDQHSRQAGDTPKDRKAEAAQRDANIAQGLDPDFDRAGLARLKGLA